MSKEISERIHRIVDAFWEKASEIGQRYPNLAIPVVLALLYVLSGCAPVVEAKEPWACPTEYWNGVVDGIPDGIVIKNQPIRIVRQPDGEADFVSREPEVFTDFALARKYGSIGLLAHNDLAGDNIAGLKVGETMELCVDNSNRPYMVEDIEKWQALNPISTFSTFVAVDADFDPQQPIGASELFKREYAVKGQLTLQTCIDANGNSSWGRMFVKAKPVVQPHP